MKVIVYPTPGGVEITSVSSREREKRASTAALAVIDADIEAARAALAALAGRAENEGVIQDRAALAARIEGLANDRAAAALPPDDDYVASVAQRLYPGGGFTLVEDSALPDSGEPTTDWTVVDGKVVRK